MHARSAAGQLKWVSVTGMDKAYHLDYTPSSEIGASHSDIVHETKSRQCYQLYGHAALP
jgi:hypothetical protein